MNHSLGTPNPLMQEYLGSGPTDQGTNPGYPAGISKLLRAHKMHEVSFSPILHSRLCKPAASLKQLVCRPGRPSGEQLGYLSTRACEGGTPKLELRIID